MGKKKALIIVSASNSQTPARRSSGEVNCAKQKIKHFPWLGSEKSFGGCGSVRAPDKIIVNSGKGRQFPVA